MTKYKVVQNTTLRYIPLFCNLSSDILHAYKNEVTRKIYQIYQYYCCKDVNERNHITYANASPLNITYPRKLCVTHHIPACILSLILKLGKLSAVVDGDEELPDEQQEQSQKDDAPYHPQHYGQHIDGLRTLWQGTGAKYKS